MDYPRYYISEFKKYLSLQTSSVNTIKNYLSDLRLFFNFIVENQKQELSPQNLPSYISDPFLKSYEAFLVTNNPPATTKRRLSSLKKFIDYCATQEIMPAPSFPPSATVSPTAAPSPVTPPETPPTPPAPPAPETAVVTPPETLTPPPPVSVSSPPVFYPMTTEPPAVSPPDYTHISHPVPPDFPPPSEPSTEEISGLVKSLADQIPSDKITPASIPGPFQSPPDTKPDLKPVSASAPSPYIVALASFLVTFFLTILIALILFRT